MGTLTPDNMKTYLQRAEEYIEKLSSPISEHSADWIKGFAQSLDQEKPQEPDWEKEMRKNFVNGFNELNEQCSGDKLVQSIRQLLSQTKSQTIDSVLEFLGRMKNHNEMLEMEGTRYTGGFERALEAIKEGVEKLRNSLK